MWAAQHGHTSIVHALVEAQADVDVQDSVSHTRTLFHMQQMRRTTMRIAQNRSDCRCRDLHDACCKQLICFCCVS
jgi:tRNA U54 and U55 pseudouridine synthase Pus10